MDALPLIVGAVLLAAGTAFALAIGMISNNDDETRERMSGGG